MKNGIFVLILPLLCLLSSSTLAMGEPSRPPTLLELQRKAEAELNSMDRDMAQAARSLSATGLLGRETSRILQKIYDDHPSAVDVATIDLKGRLLLIEPEKYKSSEGESIADQPHFITLKNTEKPVMSKIFKTVEGFYAVSLAHPILSAEGKPIGFISMVFQPDALIRNIVKPTEVSGLTLEVLAIQKDGRIVYDKDVLQVGKMTFTDPAYQDHPSLLKLAQIITREASGLGIYEYPAQYGREPLKKEAEWDTVSLHGTEWRLILSRVIE